MRKTLKAVAGLCVLVGVLFVSGGSPSGAQEGCGGYFNPCPPEGELEFTFPSEVLSGGTIRLVGSCNLPGESVEFKIGDTVIGTVEPDADGNFDVSFTVPSSIAAGTYTISGTCGDLLAEGSIRVVRSGVTPGGGSNTVNGSGSGSTPLARTGFDAAPMVTLGAAALVLGGAAVYGSKRRRTA
jgi:LPXTG-motif cell wall-anchored protein